MDLKDVADAVDGGAFGVLQKQALAGRQSASVSNPGLDDHIAGHIAQGGRGNTGPGIESRQGQKLRPGQNTDAWLLLVVLPYLGHCPGLTKLRNLCGVSFYTRASNKHT